MTVNHTNIKIKFIKVERENISERREKISTTDIYKKQKLLKADDNRNQGWLMNKAILR